MAWDHLPADWEERVRWLAAPLQAHSRWRLPVLLFGGLFGGGWWLPGFAPPTSATTTRTSTPFCNRSDAAGGKIGGRRLVLALWRVLWDQRRVLLAIDDSPTKRYGPCVQGAGIHHDPTPGPSGKAFCYGHVWVTLAAVLRHHRWKTIALPVFSWLYVREQDVAKIPKAAAGRSRPSWSKPPTWCSTRQNSCNITAKRYGASRTERTPSGRSCSRS